MAWILRSALLVLYALIIAAGLAGGIALASAPPCGTCSNFDLSACTATGVFDTVNCCMPVSGGKDCFSCQRQEYLCTAGTALGGPVNCVDSGTACN